MHHPNQTDGAILETQRERALADQRPEPGCPDCGGEGRCFCAELMKGALLPVTAAINAMAKGRKD